MYTNLSLSSLSLSLSLSLLLLFAEPRGCEAFVEIALFLTRDITSRYRIVSGDPNTMHNDTRASPLGIRNRRLSSRPLPRTRTYFTD
jgi:hypothetical protein